MLDVKINYIILAKVILFQKCTCLIQVNIIQRYILCLILIFLFGVLKNIYISYMI